MSDKSEEQALEDALVKPTPVAKKTTPKKKAPAKSKAKPTPAGGNASDPKVIVHEQPINPVTRAASEKRDADVVRRDKAIADAPRPPDPSERDLEEQKRKDDIRARMKAKQDDIDDLQAAVDANKVELKALSAELYPHLQASDHHTIAVKGYVESQKALRRTRASNPEVLKRMLAQAGKSPIDAAMSRQKARGMKRPERPQAGVIPAAKTAEA